jgi:hypothetical protein
LHLSNAIGASQGMSVGTLITLVQHRCPDPSPCRIHNRFPLHELTSSKALVFSVYSTSPKPLLQPQSKFNLSPASPTKCLSCPASNHYQIIIVTTAVRCKKHSFGSRFRTALLLATLIQRRSKCLTSRLFTRPQVPEWTRHEPSFSEIPRMFDFRISNAMTGGTTPTYAPGCVGMG